MSGLPEKINWPRACVGCGKTHDGMREFHKTMKIAIEPTVTYDEQYEMPEYHATFYLCPTCFGEAAEKGRMDSLNIFKAMRMQILGIVLAITILSVVLFEIIENNLFSIDTTPFLEDMLYAGWAFLVLGGIYACCLRFPRSAMDPPSQFIRFSYYPFMCLVKNEDFAKVLEDANPGIEIQVSQDLDKPPYHYTADKGNPAADDSEVGF